jgi:hypothetical protein
MNRRQIEAKYGVQVSRATVSDAMYAARSDAEMQSLALGLKKPRRWMAVRGREIVCMDDTLDGIETYLESRAD